MYMYVAGLYSVHQKVNRAGAQDTHGPNWGPKLQVQTPKVSNFNKLLD